MEIQTKKEIRDYIRHIKKAMTDEEVREMSKQIQNLLFAQEEYKRAENIYVYVNYNQEVVTSDIISKSLKEGKKVFVPKVCGDNIKFYQIYSMKEDLTPGAYGILEPTTDRLDEQRDGLLIMPGLAFDKGFHRLGYGGGYYDKYLALPNTHIKLALAYHFQILDCIVTDEFDQKVDMIITQNHVMRLNSLEE